MLATRKSRSISMKQAADADEPPATGLAAQLRQARLKVLGNADVSVYEVEEDSPAHAGSPSAVATPIPSVHQPGSPVSKWDGVRTLVVDPARKMSLADQLRARKTQLVHVETRESDPLNRVEKVRNVPGPGPGISRHEVPAEESRTAGGQVPGTEQHPPESTTSVITTDPVLHPSELPKAASPASTSASTADTPTEPLLRRASLSSSLEPPPATQSTSTSSPSPSVSPKSPSSSKQPPSLFIPQGAFRERGGRLSPNEGSISPHGSAGSPNGVRADSQSGDSLDSGSPSSPGGSRRNAMLRASQFRRPVRGVNSGPVPSSPTFRSRLPSSSPTDSPMLARRALTPLMTGRLGSDSPIGELAQLPSLPISSSMSPRIARLKREALSSATVASSMSSDTTSVGSLADLAAFNGSSLTFNGSGSVYMTFEQYSEVYKVRRRLNQILTQKSDVREMCLTCQSEYPVDYEDVAWVDEGFCQVCQALTKWVLIGGDALKKLFADFDNDGSGELDIEEFVQGLRSLGFEHPEEVLELLFHQIDRDSSGSLDYSEFIEGVRRAEVDDIIRRLRQILLRKKGKSDLRQLFKKFDTDSSGSLDASEFASGLRSLHFDNCDEDLLAVFRKMDLDGSGSLEFHEFVSGVLPEHLLAVLNSIQTSSGGLVDSSIASFFNEGKWRDAPNPFRCRGSAAMTVLRDKAYLLGGFLHPTSIEVLTSDSARWETLPVEFPCELHDHSCVALGDKIFIFGGSDAEGKAVNRALSFDTITLKIVELPSMELCRKDCAAVAFDGELYAIGGMDEHGNCLDLCEVFNPEICEWATLPEMNETRCGPAAAVVDGRIWVIGGGTNRIEDSCTVERWDPEEAEWEYCAPLAVARRACATAVLKDELYVLGGYSATAQRLTSVEKYLKASKSWVEWTTLPFGGPIVAVTMR